MNWFEIYGRIAITGEPARFENRAEALGRYYDVYAFRLGDPEDRQVAVLFNDVSERKRAEEELKRSEATLAAFFNASPGILNIVDEQLRYVKTDATTPTYFGLTQESIVGKTVKELAPEFTARFEAMMREVIDTGMVRSDQEVFSPVSGRAGEVAIWRASYFPVPLGSGGRGLGVIGVDITDMKRAQAEREELVKALQREDARKTEFLGVLSHELRNPLTPIKNSLYILDRVAPGGGQARRAQMVISRQVDQLARLVDDLLEITRLTSNKVRLQRERIDLGKLVHRTLEDHISTLDKAGLTVEMHHGPGAIFVKGDASRLAQVIGNLLQNAAKFTPSGGHVSVALSVDETQGLAVLRVTDTGVGLAPELLPNLFQPFSQAEQSLDRSKGGLGLGLALVKGLVELHGGQVQARSAGAHQGSEFTVCLPLDRQANVRDAVQAEAPRARRRVLVIEDDVDAADSLREVIQLDGHEVAVAYDGSDGIVKAREFRPDIVLCEIGLRGLDGYAVARALRLDESLKHARLVALDDRALSEDLQRAREAGFERHIAKPPSLDALVSIFRDDGAP